MSESIGAIRLDYTPTAKDRLFGRYTINDGVTRQTYGPNLGQTAPEALLNVYGILNETHTFSPTFVDELSVAIQKFHSNTNSETPKPVVGFLGFFTNLNTVWQSRGNLQQNFDVASQSLVSPNVPLYNGPLVDISPRVGFSYDPFGRGKTAVHAYYGLFFLPLQFGSNFVQNNAAYQSYSVNAFQVSLHYPMNNPALPAGTQNVSIFPHDAHDPYSSNWLFGVQQELMRNTILTLNYVANEDHRLTAGQNFAAVNLNSGNLVTQDKRRYANFANEYFFANELSSAYHSLQAQVRHNTGNLNYEVNYTWSHTINNLVNFLNDYSDPLNPSKDLGNGDGDIRNNFSGSVTYTLTELKGSSLLKQLTLGGWQTSSIVQTRSGEALNPTLTGTFFGLPSRPNYTGSPVRLAKGSWPKGRYDVAAFQVPAGYNGVPGDPSTLGNVPRHSLPGPAFFQLDARSPHERAL